MKKPIIGIVAKHYNCIETRQFAFVSDEIRNAVIDNGGIPIALLPPDAGINNIKIDATHRISKGAECILIEQIKCCDGIILQGGYESFSYELFIAKYCFDKDIPILGICAGHSNMLKAIGGTTKKINSDKHNKKDEYVHKIKIVQGTIFHSIIGKTEMMVNSRHNNNADNITKDYICSAHDIDGECDVLEAPTRKFNLAVKFHPESLYKTDDNHNKIFRALIEAAQKLSL